MAPFVSACPDVDPVAVFVDVGRFHDAEVGHEVCHARHVELLFDVCSLRWLRFVAESKVNRVRRSVVKSRTFSPGSNVVEYARPTQCEGSGTPLESVLQCDLDRDLAPFLAGHAMCQHVPEVDHIARGVRLQRRATLECCERRAGFARLPAKATLSSSACSSRSRRAGHVLLLTSISNLREVHHADVTSASR